MKKLNSKFFIKSKKYFSFLAFLVGFANAQTTRDLYTVHKKLLDQPQWLCANSAINTKLQGAELLKEYKTFLLNSNETFDFGKGVNKANQNIILNKGNSWAKEFNFQNSTSNTLQAIASWEPAQYVDDDSIDAQKIMLLTSTSDSAPSLTANIYERLNYKSDGKVVRTENTLVSTLYCYAENNLKASLKSLGVTDEDYAVGKRLRGDREYFEGRPETPAKLEEVKEFTAERDSWLGH